MKKPIEADLVKQIIQYLQLQGFLVWRNNTGGRSWTDAAGKKRIMRFGAVGSGDVFALKGGVFYSIEAKRPGKEPVDEQVAWAANVSQRGGVALCVHSIGELMEGLAGV